jgi:hypothetical protein
MYKPLSLIAGILLAGAPGGVAADPTPAQLDALKDDRVIPLFESSDSPEVRAHLFKRIIDDLPGGRNAVKPILEKRIGLLEGEYFKLLRTCLPGAYRKHLAGLGDDAIYQIQFERRKWRSYIEKTSHRLNFASDFFDTALAAEALAVPRLEAILPEEAAAKRAELLEFSQHLETCLKETGTDTAPDPTAAKKSPTGHPYPKLDRPRTASENFDYLEKSLVLSLTIAPEGAASVLVGNARAAREIDYEEGEFVMLGNVIRLFVGSIAWAVDPLTCACARDHSNDRKEGRASGHMSTVPGKKGFGDRCKYWGTQGSSEGAGGGSGKSYLRGLSYGGGHTGPLYSLTRNVVGIGIRQGAATSIYRTNKQLIHRCAVTEKETFMPPGMTSKEIRSAALRTVYRLLQSEKFAEAHKAAGAAQETNPVDLMVLRFFKAAIEVERDWCAQGAAAISSTGDCYFAQQYLEESLKKFDGLFAYQVKISAAYELPEGSGANPDEIKLGKTYHKLAEDVGSKESLAGNGPALARIRTFAERNAGSVYAEAAGFCLNDGKAPNGPLDYFIGRNSAIAKFGYPVP